MLVQFSMTVSRLSDQNTALAQRLALLQQRLKRDEDDEAEAAKQLGTRADGSPSSVEPEHSPSGSI